MGAKVIENLTGEPEGLIPPARCSTSINPIKGNGNMNEEHNATTVIGKFELTFSLGSSVSIEAAAPLWPGEEKQRRQCDASAKAKRDKAALALSLPMHALV